MKRDVSPLSIHGDVRTEIFSGSATEVVYVLRGYPLSFGKVVWHFDISRLFFLQLCVKFSTLSPVSQAEGHWCYGVFNRHLTLENVLISIAATEIAEVTGMMLDGPFQATVNKLHMGSTGIKSLFADITWSNAKLYNGESWLELGTMEINTLSPNPYTVVVQWSNRGKSYSVHESASPSIDISLQTVFENGHLATAQGVVKPLADHPPALLKALESMAVPQSDGSYHIQYSR